VSESFLHYLWQFQYFDKSDLTTSAGEGLVVFKPGILNTNAGPDFSDAKINLTGIDWVGSVEIHINASDWIDHRHHEDPAYENVILHVVWTENKPIYRTDGSRIPTIELKGRVDEKLITEYRRLVSHQAEIPCERLFAKLDHVIKLSMIDRVLMMRLEEKARQVLYLLNQNKGDWEETTYQLISTHFGFKVNKEPFSQLAKALPFKVIQKHRSDLLQIEALLFGQAGFLMSRTRDEYVIKLFTEYNYLSKKYSLDHVKIDSAQWKFLRLRPSNFPTLRIAQLSRLLQYRESIFNTLMEVENYKQLLQVFEITPSVYWSTHYRFGKKAESIVPVFGRASADIIIINAVVPLMVAYGKKKDDWTLVDKAIHILQQIPAEKNSVVNLWKRLGFVSKTAFDSQGLLELYHHFCQARQCLNCSIGSAILKPRDTTT